MVKFKDAFGENRANKAFPETRETLRHLVAMCNTLQMIILFIAFQKTIVLFGNKIWLCEKT